MPGHKRRKGQHDFTEIDGFEVLSHPEGIIAESQRRAAGLFGADRTYYLVNGSTAGILAGILATVNKDQKVLIGPDCHKSVYHALDLGDLTAVNLPGSNSDDGNSRAETKDTLTSLDDICRELDWDRLPTRIEQALEEHAGGIGLVVVTSPTYEGVISDIARIADIAHSHDAVLIADEAHGTHFGMDPYAIRGGNGQAAQKAARQDAQRRF